MCDPCLLCHAFVCVPATSVPVQKVSANPYFYDTTFPPTIYTTPRTPNRLLSPLVGACKKCRRTPIFMIPLSPPLFIPHPGPPIGSSHHWLARAKSVDEPLFL